jgi:ribonuclease P protein component
VSKKVGKSIVRSHVTRLIRESYRNMEEDLRCGYDIVVIARVICKDSTYHEVSASMRHLVKKHHLLLSQQEKEAEKENEKEAR